MLLRPSSTVISTSNNASELSFALEESTNLINWHTNQLIEVNLPVTNNIKFFRFRYAMEKKTFAIPSLDI